MTVRTLGAREALLGRGRGPILAALSVGWLLSLGVRLVFPAILPQLRAAFGFSLTTAGLLITVVWLAYAVGQLPGGMLGDRVGERAVLAASMLAATGTLVLLAAAVGVRSFFAGAVLFGLGTGLFATTSFTLLADVYPDRDATALGVVSAAGNLGAAVLPAVAGVLAVVVGWRAGVGFAAPLFFLTAIALWRFLPARASPEMGRGDGFSLGTARRVGRAVLRRPALLSGAGMLLMSIIYQGFTGFFPTYLVAEKGLGPGTAATLFGLFFGAGIVVQPVAGAAGDRFGPRRSMVAFSALTVASLGALPFLSGVVAIGLLTLLASAQLAYWPVVQAYAIEALPADVQGTGLGLIRTAYLIVASVGPVLVGALADAGLFDGAFLLLAAVAVATGVLAAILPVLD